MITTFEKWNTTGHVFNFQIFHILNFYFVLKMKLESMAVAARMEGRGERDLVGQQGPGEEGFCGQVLKKELF